MDREVVKELIQRNLITKNLTTELKKILDPAARDKLLKDYSLLKEKLQAGGAAAKTASLILSDMHA